MPETSTTPPWSAVLSELIAGNDLSRKDARAIVASMLAGEADSAQIGGFLVALAAKGETTDEILGMREALVEASSPIELPDGCIDIVGVGGAPRRRVEAFNVSTISALVAASAGATVCKHGNRKASSTSGSFDLLEALGVNIDASPDTITRGVNELGVGFVFARAHHPSMRHVGPARAAIGVPTVFNVLGPVAHPGLVRRQVLGVADERRANQIAAVVAGTDAEKVWIVTGHDSLDEVALSGPTSVIQVDHGVVTSFTVSPIDAGLSVQPQEVVRGGDAEANAAIAQAVLAGERSPNRDIVLLNAGAGLVVAGIADDLRDGAERCAAAIDDGRAAAKLADLVVLTNA